MDEGIEHRIIIIGDGDKLYELTQKAKENRLDKSFLLLGNQNNPFPYFKFANAFIRSEEHTSELQSRGHIVCRLLLEKKKKNKEKSMRCMERKNQKRQEEKMMRSEMVSRSVKGARRTKVRGAKPD